MWRQVWLISRLRLAGAEHDVGGYSSVGEAPGVGAVEVVVVVGHVFDEVALEGVILGISEP